jgi:transposase
MARAYSDDLRKKFLEAHAAGKGTLRQLALQFGVSVGWAFKVSAAWRRTGSMARPAQRRHGRESKVDRELLGRLVRRKPDIVLRELQAELAAEGVRVSIAMIAVVLARMGLRLKKVASRHRARHRSQPRAPRTVRPPDRPDRTRRPDLRG